MVRRVFHLFLLMLPSVSAAQDYPTPNTLLWGAVGEPWLVSAKAEGWLGEAFTGEVGVGGLGLDATIGFDWALRWRPDALCFGCGHCDLLTIGIGPGGLVAPPINWDDWRFAAGGDLGLAYVHWLSPKTGVTVAAHGGAGAGWVDLNIAESSFQWWGFGGLGLAF
jgi:hypothetical protein